MSKRPTGRRRVRTARISKAFTARYTPVGRRYMGQIVEWPEVITEGRNLQDCRESLLDALREMIITYRQLGQAIPRSEGLLEPIAVEV